MAENAEDPHHIKTGDQRVKGIISDILAKAVEKRANGEKWRPIARQLGISMYTLRHYLDPAYNARKHKMQLLLRKRKQELGYEPGAPPPPPLLKKDQLLERLQAGLGHQYQD